MSYDAWLSLAVLTGLGLGTVVTGRAVAALLRARWLRRWTPENVAASAFLGTAVWTLGFASCSYSGLHALPAALAVLGLAGGLVLVRAVALPGAPAPTWRQRAALAVALLPAALAVTTALLPVLLGDSFVYWSDSLLYSSAADWLQRHGFWDVCPFDPSHPTGCWLPLWQQCGHRMGATFLLAMVRALFPDSLALYHYPALLAWGVALNAAGAFLLCRWAFRTDRGCAVLAAVFVCGVNPLSFSAVYGFYCQVYGTAALLFALAVLARLFGRARWRFGGAGLIALAAAFQVSVYSELAPVLAVASLVCLVVMARRAWRAGRLRCFVGFAAAAFGLFGLFANVEIVRAVRGILFMVRLPAGWHVDWSAVQYWTFAEGARPLAAPLNGAAQVTAAVCSVLLLAGAAGGVRRLRAWPPLLALLVLAGLAAYFRWGARDPWTGEAGHTFNLFKLCKWSFPLLAAVQAAGLHFLLRNVWLRRAAVAAACLAVVAVLACRHRDEARMLVQIARNFSQSRSPLKEMRALRRQVEGLNPAALYLLPRPGAPVGGPDAESFCRGTIPYILNSRPFVNGWPDPRDLYSGRTYAGDRDPMPPPDGALGIMYGTPFDPPLQRLPFNVCVVDLRRPFILAADGAAPGDASDDARTIAVGPAGAGIEIWSPRAASAVLELTASAPAALGRDEFSLEVAAGEGPPAKAVALDTGRAAVPLSLRPGLNRVRLRTRGPSSASVVDTIGLRLEAP